MNPRLAYLGIGLRPEIWRHCRRLSDDEAVSLYKKPLKTAAAILGVSLDMAGDIRKSLLEIDFEAENKRLKQLEIDYLTKADPEYPAPLRDIYDPPATVFYKGDPGVLAVESPFFSSTVSVEPEAENRPVIAIVGARKCTGYGRDVARDLAMNLTKAGAVVVSGMARGIDSAAHAGALEAGSTIAVLGSGLDVIYPPENRTLAGRIFAAGVLISEFPPGTPPRPLNFPARNRIISGLASAVVVVEAAKRSGALITADFALEQGKEVLVVPGSVRSPASAGCHELIKQGASLASSADDVLEAIGVGKPGKVGRVSAEYPKDRSILNLVDFSETHIDDILTEAQRPACEVLGDLSLLETQGLICRRPGGWYTRLR